MFLLFRVLSLRYWLRHRGALLLSSLGVTLGIAVFVAIQVANHSVFAAFENSLRSISGRTTLQVEGGNNGLPDAVFARIANLHDPRIRGAAPIVSRTFYAPQLKTTLLFLGVDVFSERDFRGDELQDASGAQGRASGSTPLARGAVQFLTDPHAVAISASLANRFNLREGSTLVAFVGAQRKRFRVVAVGREDQMQNAYGGDFVLMDIAAAQENFNQVGSLSRIDLIVDDADIPAVTAVLQRLVPPDARVQRPAQRGAEVSAMLAAFRLNLSALSCITLFVGAFLIYNAIASAVVRRRSEVAILRAVGASSNQIQAMFLLESGCIGLLGALVGFALGLALSRLALGAVSTTVSSLYVAVKAREISVPAWLWWAAPAGGVLISIFAAFPAAREAASTSPRAAWQSATLHHATARFAVPMALGGAFSLALAALVSTPFFSARSALLGFGGAFATLGGFALLAPMSTLWLARLVQPLCGALFGIEGILACTQLRRALNRSSLVIASLMVALAMTVGLGVMVRSFRASVGDWVTASIRGDLYVAGATGFSGDAGPGLPREVVAYVLKNPAVKVCDSIREAQTTLVSKSTHRPQPITIAANELPTLKTGDRTIHFLETLDGIENAQRAHLENKGILVSERFKNLLGYGAGQSVTLETPDGKKSFRIYGVFSDYTPDQALIYLPRALYQKYWHDNAVDALAVHLKPEYSVEKLKAEIERKFGAKYQLALLPNAQIRKSIFTTFDRTFAVTYALQLIAVLVAGVGIFNTLWSLLLERRVEIATLRATGASTSQIAKMTLIEFGLVGVFGWALGTLAGLCLAWQLIFVINRQFFGWTIGWTWSPTVWLQALLLALFAALGAGVLPSLRASRQNLAHALRRE